MTRDEYATLRVKMTVIVGSNYPTQDHHGCEAIVTAIKRHDPRWPISIAIKEKHDPDGPPWHTRVKREEIEISANQSGLFASSPEPSIDRSALTMGKALGPTEIIVGPLRLTNENIWTPRANKLKLDKDGKPTMEFAGTFLLPLKPNAFQPNPKLENDLIVNAIKACKIAKFGADFKGAVKTPYKDGDTLNESSGEPMYPGGYWYINAREKPEYPPVVVDGNGAPCGPRDGHKGGDWVMLRVSFYAYDNQSKGVAASLRGVQFVATDEPMGFATVDPAVVAADFGKFAGYVKPAVAKVASGASGGFGDSASDESGGFSAPAGAHGAPAGYVKENDPFED